MVLAVFSVLVVRAVLGSLVVLAVPPVLAALVLLVVLAALMVLVVLAVFRCYFDDLLKVFGGVLIICQTFCASTFDRLVIPFLVVFKPRGDISESFLMILQ